MTYDFAFDMSDLSKTVLTALSVWEIWQAVRDDLGYCQDVFDVVDVLADYGYADEYAIYEAWS